MSDHPKTDPCPPMPPPSEQPTSKGGASAPPNGAGTLDEDAHLSLHATQSARLERVRVEMRQLREEMGRRFDHMEKLLDWSTGDQDTKIHEEQRHGTALAEVKLDIELLKDRVSTLEAAAAE